MSCIRPIDHTSQSCTIYLYIAFCVIIYVSSNALSKNYGILGIKSQLIHIRTYLNVYCNTSPVRQKAFCDDSYIHVDDKMWYDQRVLKCFSDAEVKNNVQLQLATVLILFTDKLREIPIFKQFIISAHLNITWGNFSTKPIQILLQCRSELNKPNLSMPFTLVCSILLGFFGMLRWHKEVLVVWKSHCKEFLRGFNF